MFSVYYTLAKAISSLVVLILRAGHHGMFCVVPPPSLSPQSHSSFFVPRKARTSPTVGDMPPARRSDTIRVHKSENYCSGVSTRLPLQFVRTRGSQSQTRQKKSELLSYPKHWIDLVVLVVSCIHASDAPTSFGENVDQRTIMLRVNAPGGAMPYQSEKSAPGAFTVMQGEFWETFSGASAPKTLNNLPPHTHEHSNNSTSTGTGIDHVANLQH